MPVENGKLPQTQRERPSFVRRLGSQVGGSRDQSVEFRCEARVTQFPPWRWRRKDDGDLPKGRHLDSWRTTPRRSASLTSGGGPYTCVAENMVGKAEALATPPAQYRLHSSIIPTPYQCPAVVFARSLPPIGLEANAQCVFSAASDQLIDSDSPHDCLPGICGETKEPGGWGWQNCHFQCEGTKPTASHFLAAGSQNLLFLPASTSSRFSVSLDWGPDYH
ncbi:roundabout homolog 1 isoform X1 [Lates japonicus]|uniref:Roundabout homolog 1 isoform X1 n=1 Tax=Lates japonicus TaxID=270547 RepID=A0AAD3MFF6_LATJO|nr:roundabout homolog 1 isoform X1 [Lates japonicus]